MCELGSFELILFNLPQQNDWGLRSLRENLNWDPLKGRGEP
jgi:hypothetical protein